MFRIAASGVFTTLHDFTAAEGGQPRTALIEGVDGHLYGTTSRGGASDSGTVFRIDLDGTLTTLCSVGPGASALIQVGGALYGTASGGGTSGLGVVFRLLLDSTLTVLHSFTLEEGSVPRAPLVLGSDGALYGTTTGGGAYGYGAAFRLAVDGAYTTLHTFNASDGGRSEPALLLASDGNFYGSTWGTPGGPSLGTVFRLAPDGTLTILHTVAISQFGWLVGALVEFEGALYEPASARICGNNCWGAIFRVTVAALATAPAPLLMRTVAGTGATGSAGDGSPASNAQITFPDGVAVDAAGNLFIADADAHRVRKVAAGSGIISTVAGTGTPGFSGDGGPATSAEIAGPADVAVDEAGDVYIADMGNHRVRKVSARSGLITSVAGTGLNGFSGDGAPATLAQLSLPRGVAIDRAGNLYIADTGNQRVRKVDLSGSITTIAGTGVPGWSGDGGLAVNAQLSTPVKVAVDALGNAYIADTDNHRVRKVTASTGVITTVAGTGGAGSGWVRDLSSPRGVAVDAAGNIYIADAGNYRIRKVSASDGNFSTVAGIGVAGFGGDGGPATSAILGTPYAIAVDSAGSLYIADPDNFRVRKAERHPPLRAAADFDGDGKPDLLWWNALSGAIDVWRMAGASFVSSSPISAAPDTAWRIVATADFNADGNEDLLFRNAVTGENAVWFMRDAERIGYAFLDTVEDLNWTIAAVTDFNGDGKADIVWRNYATGQNAVWYMNGTAYAGYAPIDALADLNWKIVGAADFDGDGKPDLLWRNTSTGQNAVWFMNGTAYLGYAWVEPLADLNWSVAMVADFNADGHPDIVWRNYATGQNAVWYMNGAAYLGYAWLQARTDTNWAVLQLPANLSPAGLPTDFNKDGRPDLLWRNSVTGENIIWYMNGAAYVSYAHVDTVADPNWKSLATGDFNGDGQSDIFWRNAATGENILWYMDGAAYVSYAWVTTVPSAWRLAAVADFTGDGKPDLVWRHSGTGEIGIWAMNGAAYVSYTPLPGVPEAAWQIVGAGDFNGDGKPDLVWRHATTGQNLVWYMNGTSYASYAYLPANTDTNWKIAMVADFNGDAKPDVLWRNSVTGENILWYLNGAAYVSYAWVDPVADLNWKIGQQQ